MALYRSSGENTDSTIIRLEDFFSTVMPCCWTTCGIWGSAWLTRFWTLTWLMSGSLPGVKTTVIATLPDDELTELK